MPIIPLIWLGGLLAGGWVLSSGADVLDASSKLARVVVVGGVVFVVYKVAVK
tara:strand:- start:757 stop:912 length:156 start_codon:yes stop_codon:yes gene_type:complete